MDFFCARAAVSRKRELLAQIQSSEA